ncbi:MAG: hypothetical protein Ct9H300mP7_0320 [Verrucomicrobiota bacterium]|nr:MAG: hypothetical protein Ct9H300mP7_0320 [Verrucomicrobiota bacterium]
MTHNQKGKGYLEVQKMTSSTCSNMPMFSSDEGDQGVGRSTMLDNSLVTYGAALGDGRRISITTCR